MKIAHCKKAQEALVKYLVPLGPLAGVPIIGRRKLNLINDIDAAIAQIGACVFVFPPLPLRVNRNVAGLPIDEFGIRVRVIESPVVNTKLPDAYELAEAVLLALHEAELPFFEGEQILANEQPVQEVEDGERVIVDVLFSVASRYPQPCR